MHNVRKMAGFPRSIKPAPGNDIPAVLLKLVLLGILCCTASGAKTIDHPFVITLSQEPHLFLDDFAIGTTINLERKLETPHTFSAQGVIKPEHPWEAGRISHPTVLWDPDYGKFRMYYTSRGAEEVKEGTGGYICYAESDDALHWQKPMLDIHQYGEHAKTNIVLSPSGEAMHVFVIRTPHDPKRPYKGIFRKRNTPQDRTGRGLYTVWSEDGLHWSEPHWISKTKCDTPPSLIWVDHLGRYFAYTRAQSYHPQPSHYFRMTGVLHSTDFNDWTPKAAINLVSEADGWPYVQNHDLQACAYGKLLLGFLTVLDIGLPPDHTNKKKWRWIQQMATSRDGWNWHPVLDREITPFWTRALVVKDGVMYLANHKFRIKTLPVDRFISLAPMDPDRAGILETRPLRFAPSTLIVNADVHPADLQVELIGESGPVVQYQSNPIEGFERDRSQLIQQDKLQYQVVWQDEKGKRTLADAASHQPLVIRFIIKRGKLFAFRTTNSAPQ